MTMALKQLLLKTSLLITGCVFFIGCSTSKYATLKEYGETDGVYENMAKGFSQTIKAYPPEGQMIDSLNNEQYFVGTVNMGMRKPNYVIIHHTAQNSTEQTLKTFTIARTAVSAHYVIGRDGKVVQMVNDFLRAQHAGLGKWGTITDMNSCSIGIELDNNAHCWQH
jgi:N-acetylmuramoyl-L-alanine amidase